MRYVHEVIAETMVQMRNAAMTIKRLKYKLFFKMRNILPTPCTMMVVGHFPCLERLFACVYAMTQGVGKMFLILKNNLYLSLLIVVAAFLICTLVSAIASCTYKHALACTFVNY